MTRDQKLEYLRFVTMVKRMQKIKDSNSLNVNSQYLHGYILGLFARGALPEKLLLKLSMYSFKSYMKTKYKIRKGDQD